MTDQSDTGRITMEPREIFSQMVRLNQTVEQNTKEVRELTQMLRGDGMNTGLVIEHERVKNKIDYDNPRPVSDRVTDLERMARAAMWVLLLVLASGIINLISFIGDLLTHQASIIHP